MDREIELIFQELAETGRLLEERNAFQHGSTTVLEHSIAVAVLSLHLARRLRRRGMAMHENELIRGALLHDYFLYDWHEHDRSHSWHGFFHPGKALRNAEQDYAIGEIEKDIIAHHMFPLVPSPPRRIEAWLVCAADKYCATRETLRPLFHKKERKTNHQTAGKEDKT